MTGEHEILNARVTDTFLGVEDHGLFIAQIGMDYSDGSHQASQRILNQATAYEYLKEVLVVFGVDSWEQINGKYCRALIRDGYIRGIGNIMRDVWTSDPDAKD